MTPNITLLTLGVDNLERSVAFYREGLGFETKGIIGTEIENGAVAFFQLQSGLKLALWPRRSLSADTGLSMQAPSALEFSIGHNVSSQQEVDAVMRQAEQAGARIVKPAQPTFYGLRGLFPGRPRRSLVGGGIQSRLRIAGLKRVQAHARDQRLALGRSRSSPSTAVRTATLDVRRLGPGDVAALRGMLSMFGAAFGELAAYTGRQPDDGYLERLLSSSTFVALAAFAGEEVVGGDRRLRLAQARAGSLGAVHLRPGRRRAPSKAGHRHCHARRAPQGRRRARRLRHLRAGGSVTHRQSLSTRGSASAKTCSTSTSRRRTARRLHASGISMAPNLQDVDHIHVLVADRAAAERWYARALGLHRIVGLEGWASDDGPLTLGNRSGTIHLALFERSPEKSRSTIALSCSGDEFLAWKAHLSAVLGRSVEAVDHELSWSLYFGRIRTAIPTKSRRTTTSRSRQRLRDPQRPVRPSSAAIGADSMLGFFRPPAFADPELGELRRARGHWRGLILLEGVGSVPLAIAGSRRARIRQRCRARAPASALLTKERASVEQAIFDHIQPYVEAIAAGGPHARRTLAERRLGQRRLVTRLLSIRRGHAAGQRTSSRSSGSPSRGTKSTRWERASPVASSSSFAVVSCHRERRVGSSTLGRAMEMTPRPRRSASA